MIESALKYELELNELLYDTWYNDKYKYYHYSNTRERMFLPDSDANSLSFVSINKDSEILGFIACQIDRQNDFVSGIGIINFATDTITFGLDVGRVFKDLFEKFNFRKIEFGVVVGNPIEKSYDKLVARYGGRVVGTHKQNVKLIDNQFYDTKIYEIFRTDYLSKKEGIRT